jgi:hypothetical protein
MIQRISEDLLWSQIVARAWCDEDFMKRLRSDPRAVLSEEGLEVARATEVEVVEGPEARVMEDIDAVRRFVLPASPSEELTDEELFGEAVAWCCGACGRCGGCGCRCRC